ncbi:MAG: hypothetical protein MJZ68_07800 [archaeon]|nr:hypothetical protein [archaeon]
MDDRGVLGLPMRLAVVMVVLALCVPVLAHVANDFQDRTENDLACKEAGKVASVAREVYHMGEGGSSTVEISVLNGYALILGGESTDAYRILVRSPDGRDTVVPLDNREYQSARFVGGSVSVIGHMVLKLTCKVVGGEYGVEVSAI